MVLNAVVFRILCFYLFYFIQVTGFIRVTQDQSTSRTNTLIDDADDIQRQLDNELRDRFKYGQSKTIFVFHLPTQFPVLSFEKELARKPRNSDPDDEDPDEECDAQPCRQETMEESLPPPCKPDSKKEWMYCDQHKWFATYPDCGGRSQSPVNLPVAGLVKARGARQLLFCNYDVMPTSLTLVNNGKTITLYGEWDKNKRPLVYGGAAHSRRYLFHSLTVHWPSEHMIGGLQYPMESHLLHISADYSSFDEALDYSSSDPQAFLGIVNIYKYGDHTHPGLKTILKTVVNLGVLNYTVPTCPLSFFSPPFNDYVCYQGSLTTPPCTESVLWLIRGKSLPVVRNAVEAAHGLHGDTDDGPRRFFIRNLQPLNDRRVFIFH